MFFCHAEVLSHVVLLRQCSRSIDLPPLEPVPYKESAGYSDFSGSIGALTRRGQEIWKSCGQCFLLLWGWQ